MPATAGNLGCGSFSSTNISFTGKTFTEAPSIGAVLTAGQPFGSAIFSGFAFGADVLDALEVETETLGTAGSATRFILAAALFFNLAGSVVAGKTARATATAFAAGLAHATTVGFASTAAETTSHADASCAGVS